MLLEAEELLEVEELPIEAELLEEELLEEDDEPTEDELLEAELFCEEVVLLELPPEERLA